MLRQVVRDEFFDNQPERKFIKKLREYEFAKINFADCSKNNAIAPKSIAIDKGVFAKDKNLSPVWFDFDEFLKLNGIKGEDFIVSIQKVEGYEKEEYEIVVTEKGVIIKASETEGVRRGVLKLEDLLVQGHGSLELATTHEKALIKRRISRGFFSPINRPPKGADELGTDEDFYPEPYLNRMMHDGVNALWVYSDFDSLVESSYIPEFGQFREHRLKKLNKLIEKAAKYGMEIFMFLIAPMSLQEPAIASKYPGIFEKYPQVHGNSSAGPTAFCVYTDFGAGYLKEASEGLIKAAPGLGGIMSITKGERTTSCGNSWPMPDGTWKNNCPHCAGTTKHDSITRTVALFKEGMDAVEKDKYDFISWTYGMRGTSDEDMEEYIVKSPKNAISMVNFEDDGRVYQLGKKRFAFDYFLCYPGPSRMYKKIAEYAKKHGRELYAKMQVCCSHELASVPYIPVPGLIYDKMVGAVETGTTGVMECWFFGSYPCIMSKSVGMLSGDNQYATKQEFLFDLAKLYWKKEEVPHAVSAWEYFEKAYTSYPVNVMFNYYGPMHDGIVWDLSLKPKNFTLPRTWQLMDKTDGDRIGDCLQYGHTIDEAIILCEELYFNWEKGCEQLAQTEEWNNPNNEQVNIAKALRLLFRSGLNILKFYRHRQNIGYGRCKSALAELKAMKAIVKDEIANSSAMIPLCKADNRLGWHSEAEGYKFHPAKLRARIKQLRELLKTEFVEVENRIKNNQIALTYYVGDEPEMKHAKAGRNGLESAEWIMMDDQYGTKFRIAEDGDYFDVEVFSNHKDSFWVTFETELMFPQCTYVFDKSGRIFLWGDARSHQSVNDERLEEFMKKWKATDLSNGENMHMIGRVSKKDIDFKRYPFKLNVGFYMGARWCREPHPMGGLGHRHHSPGEFGWIE